MRRLEGAIGAAAAFVGAALVAREAYVLGYKAGHDDGTRAVRSHQRRKERKRDEQGPMPGMVGMVNPGQLPPALRDMVEKMRQQAEGATDVPTTSDGDPIQCPDCGSPAVRGECIECDWSGGDGPGSVDNSGDGGFRLTFAGEEGWTVAAEGELPLEARQGDRTVVLKRKGDGKLRLEAGVDHIDGFTREDLPFKVGSVCVSHTGEDDTRL